VSILNFRQHQHCAGYSLVELSVVMVILGLLLSLGTKLVPQLTSQEMVQENNVKVSDVNQAIIGFAMVAGRLPCPDSTGNGLENCTPLNTGGLLPYLSLALPAPALDSDRKAMRYGVYQAANLLVNSDAAVLSPPNWRILDKDVSANIQRYVPLLPAKDGNAAAIVTTPYQNNNGLDLCFGLKNISQAAVNNIYVHADDGTSVQHVAYALASSGRLDANGDGNLFDGRNVLGNNLFDSPDRRSSDIYDDQVFTMSAETLLGQLSCSQALAALHAQANVATAALRSIVMFQDQLGNANVGKLNANANVAAAVVAGLSAGAAVADAAASVSTSLSITLTTLGATSFSIGLAAAAVAMAAAAVVSAAAVVATTVMLVADANGTVAGAQALVLKSQTLAATILGHVAPADQAGVYGW